jgi:8-oxo-dGTP pyrophosphatase MutT (NUDIX family)
MAHNGTSRVPWEHNGRSPIREDRRQRDRRIEVHVAVVCIRPSGDAWEVLLGKRTGNRSLYPGKWECGGGHVRAGESLEQAARRQIFEEFGLEIEIIGPPLEIYSIDVPDGQRLIPGIRFLGLAGTASVRLNRREFRMHEWVRFPVPADRDYIDGVKKVLDRLGPELYSRVIERKPPSSERGGTPSPSRAIN